MNSVDSFAVTPESTPSARAVFRAAIEGIVMLLSPLAPHVAEELWQVLGHDGSILKAAWPAADPVAMQSDMVEIVVQVNGRVRDRLNVPAKASQADIEALARGSEAVKRHLEGKPIRKVVVVPGKLVNIVAA